MTPERIIDELICTRNDTITALIDSVVVACWRLFKMEPRDSWRLATTRPGLAEMFPDVCPGGAEYEYTLTWAEDRKYEGWFPDDPDE